MKAKKLEWLDKWDAEIMWWFYDILENELDITMMHDSTELREMLKKSKSEAIATARAEGAAEERKRIAKEYGDYRYYVDQKKLFGRHKIGRTLRFFLLPHTEHKKGDDKDIT